MTAIKTYLLIDAPETLDCMVRKGFLELANVEVISLYKRASIACEKRGIKYKIIENFSNIEDTIKFTLKSYDNLLAFCERYDSIAKEQLPELKSRGINPFQFSYYHLKILIDSVSVKLYQMYHFLKKAEDATIIYRREDILDNEIPENLFYQDSLNLFAVVLEEIKAQLKFNVNFLAIGVSLNTDRKSVV